MSTSNIWAAIEELVGSATRRVVLVAPFIKRGVVDRLVAVIPPGVELECYTRWEPDEVARGVSDPDIIDLPELAGRVRLCANLHAKAIVVDDRAFVGSANLTRRALGLVEPANIEIMVEVPANHEAVLELLRLIRSLSIQANANLADAVTAAAAGRIEEHESLLGVRPFYPTSRSPKALESVYRGSPVGATAKADLEADLMRLGVPSGLDTAGFRAVVGRALMENPALESLTFVGSVESSEIEAGLIERLGIDPTEATRSAETMLMWVEEFCDVHSEPSAWRLVLGKEFG